MGVSNAWGQSSPHMYLIGQPVNTWEYDNNNNYPINNYYGQYDRFCIYVWMENGQTFALHNGNHQYGPKYNDKEPLSTTTGNGEGKYFEINEQGNAWIYTGNSGLVRICVNQETTSTSSEYYPYVWVEELTKVMDGTEVMFYFGDTWNEGYKYLRTTSLTNSEFYWGWCGTHSNGSPKFGFHKLDANNTYATCCKAPTGKYYISNNSEWSGIQMSANAEAGAMYSLTNNGSNIINVISGVKPTWGSNQTQFKVYKGIAQSGIVATCDNSVINKPNTIYYCYTQDNQNFYRFNPDDVSNLPLGTYTVWAIACDGHIAVRSATSVELQIKNCTVKLNGTSDGQFIVKHNENYYTSPSQGELSFQVPYGDEITIVESKHNFSDIYNGDLVWKEENGNWIEFNSPKNQSITVNNDILIAENFVVGKHAVEDKKLHLFLRIPKNLDKAKDDEGNMGWKGNDCDDGSPTDGYSTSADDCANFVWLTTGVHHEVKGSTLEERGCPGTTQPNGHFLMRPLAINDPDFNVYHCTVTDSCWYFIKFERKHADSDHNNPPLMETEAPAGINLAETNCFTITGYKDGRVFNGQWEPAPKCTVTLGFCEFGTYAIEYNGQKYFAQQPKQNVTIPVAFGEKIKILEGQPASNAYSGGTILDALDPDPEFRALAINEEIIVKKDFTVDDNFVTKGEHVVYLGVPTSLSDWEASNISNQQADEYAYYIWRQNRLGWINMEDEYDKSCEYLYEDNGIRYYKFRIKAGCYAFQFQRKKNNRNSDNGTFAQSQTLFFQIPLDNVNCYTLRDEKSDDTHYLGSWGILPPRPGDYRLLYAEKKLIKTHEEGESEDWETAFRTIDSHPSDVIRKRTDLNTGKDTVSLHIYTQRAYDTIPMVILQQYQTVNSTNQWVDIEAHTVLPLKAHGNMGMLPSRKKAYGELPFYSDGIDAIKDDLVDKGSGVWNFIVEQAKDENTKNMTTTLHLDKDKLKRYEGTYYIRTTNTLGGWINYYNEDNHMKISSYSKQYRGFSHYYCKWVDITKHSEDVRFVVANDYGSAISKELIADTYSNSNGEITENANIRWSWNIVNNKVSRAYIQGTWNTNSVRLDNIVAKYKTHQSASDSRELLDDTGDWIYSKDIKNVQVGSQLVSLTAQYPSGGDTQIFAEDMDMLIGEIEHNQNKYVVRILYDFKIDKTMVTLVPDEKNADIAIDVLIERIDQGEATQVRSNITNNYKTITNANGETETGATVYAMMTFNKAQLIDPDLSDQRRFTYWISFPFDVNIADVFGFSEYGKQWRIRTYNSRSRAENGYNGTQTYWEYIDINQTPVLEANKGYILVLNAKLRNPDHSAYTNRSSLSLYFPSANLINNLDTACIETPVVVPRNEGQAPSKDWNWNMIGVPSYANKDRTISQDHLYYFFEYNYDTDSYEVCWAGKEQTFKSMFAYMVQFAGTIDWTNFKVNSGQFPEQLAAKKDASAEINHVMRLELLRNNQREDKTYIQLTENENATEQFDMNFDLTKMANAKANLYSLIGNHQLAANVLPMEATTVPLGVIIKTAGEYTFSMPDGTAGITAELIDYQTNTRTNLLLDNYTVTLPAGTNNSRFALSLQPDKTVTSVDNIGNEATGDKVKKYLIDGKLYLQKDGVLYDAQGHSL